MPRGDCGGRKNLFGLIGDDVFVLQSFNSNRNSRIAFYSVGLSVPHSFESPIYITARLWNDALYKNSDEGLALRFGIPDRLRDDRLEVVWRNRLSFHGHLDVPIVRVVAELRKLEIAILPTVLPLLACASI
jgi:hypothetical protein